MIRQLKYRRRRLDAGPPDPRVIRLLEGADESIDGRVSHARRLDDGPVQDEDGDSSKKIDVVEIVDLALQKTGLKVAIRSINGVLLISFVGQSGSERPKHFVIFMPRMHFRLAKSKCPCQASLDYI